MDENEKLKKKIQEVDIRHEHVGKDLLKKLNAIEAKHARLEKQNLQGEFTASRHAEKLKDIELVLNLI